MAATNKQDDYFETLAKCQMKLLEINQKLLEIKKRHCKMDNLFPNKGGKKQKTRLEENYNLLMKEAELLERDIAFVSSLMECGNDANRSLTSRIMQKVLPGRMFYTFGRETSRELKVSIMAHSTKFLEDKVSSLEILTKRSKKKKIDEELLYHGDLEKPSIDKYAGSSSSSKSRIKIDNKTSELEEEMSSNSRLSSSSCENGRIVFKNDLHRDNSVFALDEIRRQQLKWRKKKQTVNKLDLAEKFSQTENTECIRSSSVNSLEKCIQTEGFQISFMNPEICVALRKVFDECINRDKIQLDGEDPYDDSESYDLSESTKEDSLSADKYSRESSNRLKEPALPSVLSYLQNNFSLKRLLTLDSNALSNLVEEIECNSKVDREFLIFGNSVDHSKTIGHRKVTRQNFLLSLNSYIPEMFFIKECVNELCVLQYDFPHQSISETKSLSSNCNGLSVQVMRKQSLHEPLTNTLEIDYCHNANTSGRIVLTEVGSDQCLTQTEIFGRIVSYLLGLKTTTDNT